MSKDMAEKKKKEFMQAIIHSFVAASSQNSIERIEYKYYISPNNNTDTVERFRFEIQLKKQYSLRVGFLRLYLKLATAIGMVIDNSTLEKIRKNCFGESF